MKKFFALFLCTTYFIFFNAGFAWADNLYFVKNSNIESIKPSIVEILHDKNFVITKQDPYYAVSSKDNSEYILIILQKSSSNYFYYIDSNNNTSVNKNILKAIKKLDVEYEESFNSQYLQMFENQAQKVLSNTVGQYSFQQPTQEQIVVPKVAQPQIDNTSLRGSVIQVAKGSTFKTYLETAINTSTANVGDEVRAVLSENWVSNGRIIAPQGSLLTGRISTARHAAYGSRNGRVVFNFNTLTTPDGKSYSISAEEVDFTVTNDGKWSKAAGNIAVGVLTGALIGLLIGACSKDVNTWKSTAISAGAGAAAGTIGAVAERGIDAEIPIYTELEVSLLKPFSIVASY